MGADAPLIPEAEPGGRPRRVPTRELVDAILYFLRAGMAWRLLPHDLPPWQTTTICGAGNARACGTGSIMRWSWPTASAPAARPARPPPSSTANRSGPPINVWPAPSARLFRRPDPSSLHQRIRSQGRTLAKMKIRASRASERGRHRQQGRGGARRQAGPDRLGRPALGRELRGGGTAADGLNGTDRQRSPARRSTMSVGGGREMA